MEPLLCFSLKVRQWKGDHNPRIGTHEETGEDRKPADDAEHCRQGAAASNRQIRFSHTHNSKERFLSIGDQTRLPFQNHSPISGLELRLFPYVSEIA